MVRTLRLVAMLGVLAALAPIRPAPAQAAPGGSLACADSAGGADAAAGPAIRTAIDTSIVIDVARRRWSETDVRAGTALGVSGTERANVQACVGATVSLQRVEMEIVNARGQVHFRATLAPLLEVLRRHQAQPNPRRDR